MVIITVILPVRWTNLFVINFNCCGDILFKSKFCIVFDYLIVKEHSYILNELQVQREQVEEEE